MGAPDAPRTVRWIVFSPARAGSTSMLTATSSSEAVTETGPVRAVAGSVAIECGGDGQHDGTEDDLAANVPAQVVACRLVVGGGAGGSQPEAAVDDPPAGGRDRDERADHDGLHQQQPPVVGGTQPVEPVELAIRLEDAREDDHDHGDECGGREP